MLYQAPDIRKQKIEDAEAFIQAKRAKRMITLMTYKQKLAEKNGKIKDYELDKFRKQCDRFDKLMTKIVEDINKADNIISLMSETHNRIVNVENTEVSL